MFKDSPATVNIRSGMDTFEKSEESFRPPEREKGMVFF